MRLKRIALILLIVFSVSAVSFSSPTRLKQEGKIQLKSMRQHLLTNQEIDALTAQGMKNYFKKITRILKVVLGELE